MLSRGGFEIVGEAEDGLVAVEKYKALKPDIVIMDIMMPKMNGIDAIREIKAFDPLCKIIVCSSLHQTEVIKEANSAGAMDFIFKPFEMPTIVESVTEALKHS
jgi:two-component system chemotaxis response regulator CheY